MSLISPHSLRMTPLSRSAGAQAGPFPALAGTAGPLPSGYQVTHGKPARGLLSPRLAKELNVRFIPSPSPLPPKSPTVSLLHCLCPPSRQLLLGFCWWTATLPHAAGLLSSLSMLSTKGQLSPPVRPLLPATPHQVVTANLLNPAMHAAAPLFHHISTIWV